MQALKPGQGGPSSRRDTRRDFVLGMDPNFLLRWAERIARRTEVLSIRAGWAAALYVFAASVYSFCALYFGPPGPDPDAVPVVLPNAAPVVLPTVWLPVIPGTLCWLTVWLLLFGYVFCRSVAKMSKLFLDRADGVGPFAP